MQRSKVCVVPGNGPPEAASAKAAGKPSVGSIERTTTSSSSASSQGGVTPAIAQFKEMGFSEEVSRRVLNECAWDVNKAIDHLVSTEVPEGAKVVESEPPAHGDQGAPTPEEAACSGAEASTESSQSEGEQPPPPTKRLERVTKAWTAGDLSQLGVVAGEFVYVWTWSEMGKDVGWIFAEVAGNQEKMGWLPQCILQELPEGQRWMRAKSKWQARDPVECSVEVGEFCLVWVSSLTKEGWTYVECQDSAGWLPHFCLVAEDEGEGSEPRQLDSILLLDGESNPGHRRDKVAMDSGSGSSDEEVLLSPRAEEPRLLKLHLPDFPQATPVMIEDTMTDMLQALMKAASLH